MLFKQESNLRYMEIYETDEAFLHSSEQIHINKLYQTIAGLFSYSVTLASVQKSTPHLIIREEHFGP